VSTPWEHRRRGGEASKLFGIMILWPRRSAKPRQDGERRVWENHQGIRPQRKDGNKPRDRTLSRFEVDNPFSRFLDETIASVYQGPLATKRKEHFLNDKKEKMYFAYLISKNFIRGKFFRDSSLSMREKVQKKLIVMQSSFEGKPIDEDKISVEYPKEAGAVFQIEALLDEKTVTDFASLFAARPWILVKNETPSPFITSDNLLSWYPTGELPPLQGRGFAAKFTRWYLPISPTLAIEFQETQKTKELEPYDLSIREEQDESLVRRINRCIAMQSMVEIYSSTNHLNYLVKMLKKHPHKKDYGPTVL
jgi:hypothetical protein